MSTIETGTYMRDRLEFMLINMRVVQAMYIQGVPQRDLHSETV